MECFLDIVDIKRVRLAKVTCLCYNSLGFYKKYSNYSERTGKIIFLYTNKIYSERRWDLYIRL